MAIVTIRFAKAHLLQFINRVLRGEEIVIARGSRPVVRLVAIKRTHPPRTPTATGTWGVSPLGCRQALAPSPWL